MPEPLDLGIVYLGERRLAEEKKNRYIGSDLPPRSIAEAETRLDPPRKMTPEEKALFRSLLEAHVKDAENQALKQKLYGQTQAAPDATPPKTLQQAGESFGRKAALVAGQVLAPEQGTPPMSLDTAGKTMWMEALGQASQVMKSPPSVAAPTPVSPAQEDAQMQAADAAAVQDNTRQTQAEQAPGVLQAIQRGFDETVTEVSGLMSGKEQGLVQTLAGKNLPAKVADVLLAALPSTTIKNTLSDIFMQSGIAKQMADPIASVFAMAGSLGYAATNLPSLYSLTKEVTKAAVTGGVDAIKALAQAEKTKSLISRAGSVMASESGMPESIYKFSTGLSETSFRGLPPELRQVVESAAMGQLAGMPPGVRQSAQRIATAAEKAVEDIPPEIQRSIMEVLDPGGTMREGLPPLDKQLLATRVASAGVLAYLGYNTSEDHTMALAAAVPFLPKSTVVKVVDALKSEAGAIRQAAGMPEAAVVRPATAEEIAAVMSHLGEEIAAGGDKIVKLNWAEMRKPGALDTVIDAVIKAKGIGSETRQVATDGSVEALSTSLGFKDVAEFIEKNPRSGLSEAEVRSYTDLVMATRNRLLHLAKLKAAGEPGADAAFAEHFATTALVYQRGLNFYSEWGRAGRAMQDLPTNLRSEFEALKNIAERPSFDFNKFSKALASGEDIKPFIFLPEEHLGGTAAQPGPLRHGPVSGPQTLLGGEIGQLSARMAEPNPMEGLQGTLGKASQPESFAGTKGAVTPPLSPQEALVKAAETATTPRELVDQLEPNLLEDLLALLKKARQPESFAGTKGAISPALSPQEQLVSGVDAGAKDWEGLKKEVSALAETHPMTELKALIKRSSQPESFAGTKGAVTPPLSAQEALVKAAESATSPKDLVAQLEPNALEDLLALLKKSKQPESFAGTKSGVSPPLSQQESIVAEIDAGAKDWEGLKKEVSALAETHPMTELKALIKRSSQPESFAGTQNAVPPMQSLQDVTVQAAETPTQALKQAGSYSEEAQYGQQATMLRDLAAGALLELPKELHPNLLRRWWTSPEKDLLGIAWDGIVNSMLMTVHGNQVDYMGQFIMTGWKIAEMTVASAGPLEAAAGAAIGYAGGGVPGALLGTAAGVAAHLGMSPADHRRLLLEGPAAFLGAIHAFTEALGSFDQAGVIARASLGGAIGGAAAYATAPSDASFKDTALRTFTGTAMGVGGGALTAGKAVGAGVGAVAGYASTPSDAGWGETAARMAGGAALGAGAGEASNRLLSGRPSMLAKNPVLAKREIPNRAPLEYRLGIDREVLRDEPGSMAGVALDWMRVVANSAGESMQFPGNVMKATEQYWKLIDQRMIQWSEAYRSAMLKGAPWQISAGEGGPAKLLSLMNPKEIKNRAEAMAYYANRYMDRQDPMVQMKAEDFADYATLTSPLGKWGEATKQMVNAIPPVHFVTAFFQTPVNAVKGYLDTIPGLNLLATKTTQELRSPDAAVRDSAYARLAMGSMLSAVAGKWAMDGLLTGRNTNRSEGSRMLARDELPEYSLKIGNPDQGATKGTYLDISRLGLLGQHLMMVADLHSLWKEMVWENVGRPRAADWPYQLLGAMTATGMAVSNVVIHPTYFNQWGQLAKTVNPQNPGEVRLDKLASNLLGMFIPTVFRQATGEDQWERKTMGFIDSMYTRVPGYRQNNLWPDVNASGDNVVRNQTATWAETYLATKLRNPLNDPVSHEHMRLGLTYDLPGESILGPKTPDLRGEKPSDGVPLTNEEHFWYRKLAGNHLKIRGDNLRTRFEEWGLPEIENIPKGAFVGYWDAMEYLQKTDKYQELTDKMKGKIQLGFMHAFREQAGFVLALGKEWRDQKMSQGKWKVPENTPVFTELGNAFFDKYGERAEDLMSDENQIVKMWQKIETKRGQYLRPAPSPLGPAGVMELLR